MERRWSRGWIGPCRSPRSARKDWRSSSPPSRRPSSSERLTALVQGALVGIAFAVVGFPSPLVFGALAGALSLLPIGGTALVWLPGAVILAAQGRWPWAIGMALYGGVIVSVVTNNVLKPRLISGHAEIGTLPVFFGVLGGLAAFGLIGMLLGPVVIALAQALLSWAEEGKQA